MKFERRVKVVDQRLIEKWGVGDFLYDRERMTGCDVGDFLYDREQITEFLNAIENSQSFEDIYEICYKYLRYGIDGGCDKTQDTIETNFYDDLGNKYFIYFYGEIF